MKKLISLIIAFSMFSHIAYADCDFKTGITPNDNGSYTYTKDCHLKVGEMKRDLETANKQIDLFKTSLDYKDLALKRADERADLWMNTAFKLEDRVNTLDQMRKTNEWLYFGLGVLTVFAAGYAARQAYGH